MKDTTAQKANCNKELYCSFLISALNNFTATHFAECIEKLSHDKITRWLRNTKLTPKIIWERVKELVDQTDGWLIGDDTILDKSYSRENEVAQWQYSGTCHKVVMGIGLLTLLWTKNKEHIPIDFRIYSKKKDGKTKNEHFREMLTLAKHRGFRGKGVTFDSWYSSLKTLQLLRKYNWTFIAGLKSDRLVSFKPKEFMHVSEVDIPVDGLTVHLYKFGLVKVFKVARTEKDIRYYATNNLNLNQEDIQEVVALRWKVEEYHRGLKQTCGAEKCQSRSDRSQRTHIFCSILSFIALEVNRLQTGMSWYQISKMLDQQAIKGYLLNPILDYSLFSVIT